MTEPPTTPTTLIDQIVADATASFRRISVLVDDPAIVLIAVLDVRTDRQDDATTAAVTRGLLDAYRAEQDRRAATLKATRDDLAARSAALTVTDLRAARRLVKS